MNPVRHSVSALVGTQKCPAMISPRAELRPERSGHLRAFQEGLPHEGFFSACVVFLVNFTLQGCLRLLNPGLVAGHARNLILLLFTFVTNHGVVGILYR